jgi:hypothetical protein
MAEALDISVQNEKWPTILLSASAPSSFYSHSKNSITISPQHLHDGFIYGEEVAHFLRTFVCPPSESASADEKILDKATQEFFGRLGRDFAQRVCSGTPLSALFDGSTPQDGKEMLALVTARRDQIESAISNRQREAWELSRSAALFGGLLDELEGCITTERGTATTLFPEATALLELRVPELSATTEVPTSTHERLQSLRDFLSSRGDLDDYEIEKVKKLLRSCRDADEHRASALVLEAGTLGLRFEDAEIHARAYSDAEEFTAKHPDTWHEHFKKLITLSVDELRRPQGYFASLFMKK